MGMLQLQHPEGEDVITIINSQTQNTQTETHFETF